MYYDIIGDVHGQFAKLEALLKHMGYQKTSGVYQQRGRQAIFVGDIVDRGTGQLDCLHLVRSMVEAGAAQMVMGNHEYNAICWATPDPYNPGDYLRPHYGDKGEHNYFQHKAFLEAMQGKETLYQATINWFKTLPLWIDLEDIRVVHACWSAYYMQKLKPQLTPGNQLTDELLAKAGQKACFEYDAVETILKGPEVRLPTGFSFQDKDGFVRDKVRIKWWDQTAKTYPQLALPAAGDKFDLPDVEVNLPVGAVIDDVSKPIFFGHYWMRGTPMLQTPNIACLDYSAASDGPLVAYRWQGEVQLCEKHFYWC